MSERFEEAVAVILALPADDTGMAEPILSAMPVAGVSVSTLGDLLSAETLSASDGRIARVDELQFDLGEGPCWDALRLRRPVLEPDLRAGGGEDWPAFRGAVRQELDIAAVFAFPLLIGPLKIGAIDMYRTEPGALSAEHREQSESLAELVSRHVLRRALLLAGREEHPEDGTSHSRRTVHQAVGFVIAQLGVSPEDAALLLRGHAFAEDRSLREVAEDVLARRLRFTASGDQIEDAR